MFYNDVDDNQLAEGVRILYQQSVNVSIIQVILALTVMTFNYAAVTIINYAWLLVLFSIFLIRIWMVKAFNTLARTDKEAIKWGRYYSYTALVTGTCWGVSAFIFTEGYSFNLAWLSFIVVVVSLGSILATTYWLEGFYAFVVPANVLLSIKFLLSNEALFMGIGFAGIIYLLCLVIFGKLNNKLTLTTISYKFKNLDVIDELERATSSKARFFAAANHDLRQPINSLGLIANSLSEQPQSSRSETLLANHDTTLNRLNHLLDSLLDISSIESGSIKYKLHVCPLDDVFRTILIEHLDQCRAKSLELRIRPSKGSVISDELALGRILSNLVSNAIKYTNSGGILIGCRDHSDNHLCIEIWDTGLGIDSENLEHIFEEFYQIDNEARQVSDGLGLGLPICRLLTEQLGHKLFVSSRPGRGTVVKLLIEKATTQSKDINTTVEITATESHHGQHILLIEDDDMARSVLSDLLRQRGAHVTTAFDFDSAMNACVTSNNKFDLIISDYRLPPPYNGIEVIDKIRTTLKRETLSAILISGDREPELDASTTEGEISFVPKPININDLAQTIKHSLAK